MVELVTPYLEGDLDAAGRAAVEEHLSWCGDCGGYVQQVRRLVELSGGLGCGPAPARVVEDAVERFRRGR